jgi:hypothetical protein
MRGGRVVAESNLETFGSPVRLKLTADRIVLTGDGEDLAFVTVEAVDENGSLQMNSGRRVQFSSAGAGVIAAVGSGDGESRDSYAGNTFNLFHGRALVVLRASGNAGKLSLTATAEGLRPSSLAIETRRGSLSPELQWSPCQIGVVPIGRFAILFPSCHHGVHASCRGSASSTEQNDDICPNVAPAERSVILERSVT